MDDAEILSSNGAKGRVVSDTDDCGGVGGLGGRRWLGCVAGLGGVWD